jgi:RHS repeat-associated protein
MKPATPINQAATRRNVLGVAQTFLSSVSPTFLSASAPLAFAKNSASNRIPSLLCLLAASTCFVPAHSANAAGLESQWRNLPEIKARPESGSVNPGLSVAGGNSWQQVSQMPTRVPVMFWGEFNGTGNMFATLNGVTVSFNNPDPNCNDGPYDTPAGTVQLELYKTYVFTLSGDNVYLATSGFSVPSQNDVFSGRTVGQVPARYYNVFYSNQTTHAWEKVCQTDNPTWNIDLCTPNMTANFLVQVRPDLGARPVRKPGLTGAGGEDQPDDAWTRDEPAIDASTAPGDGEPLQIGSSKKGDPSSVRFMWSASLGRLWSGAGAGRIRIDQSDLSSNAYTPQLLTYTPRSSDTNELLALYDLDITNCLSQINTPQTLATIDQRFGSALLSTNDIIGARDMTQKLTNHVDQVSLFLWTNFTLAAQNTLISPSTTVAQLQSTIIGQVNPILQGPSIYTSNRFAAVTLSGRTRRLLLKNPTGSDLIRLNRFLLEDAYPSDVARLSSSSFDLQFFTPAAVGPKDSLGFFTLLSGATSFVTWRIGLPDNTTNQWQVQEIRNGNTNTSLLQYTPGSGLWTLTRGTGNEARIETRTIVSNVVAGVTNCIETQQIKNGAGTVSDSTAEAYQKFGWGYELVNVTNDPGGANLVTQFTFNTDTNDLATYGQIASIVYPDGFWERRQYSEETSDFNRPYGSLLRTIQPWKDAPISTTDRNCLVNEYLLPTGGMPGSYRLQKWHDPSTQGISDPYYYEISNVVYQEITFFTTDPCASQGGLIAEQRQMGSTVGYGEFQNSSTYSAYYGRLAGQLYSKADDITRVDSYDYEWGVWNAAAYTFTDYPTAPTDHDMRQTIFHGVEAGLQGDQFTNGPSGSSIQTLTLNPFRSTKEIRIIQGGNLAAKEVYAYQGNWNFALISRVIYQRDPLGHATNVFRVDPKTSQTRVIYQADWQGGAVWPSDLKISETDENGIVYNNTYDSLKRVKTKTKLAASGQSAIVVTSDYDPANRVLTNTTSAGSLSLKTISQFDLSGRLTSQTDPAGLTTSYSYQNGGRQTTITGSSGTSQTIAKYLDRRVASLTGTAVTNQFYDYALLNGGSASPDIGYPKNLSTISWGTSNSLRWTATATDPGYRTVEERKPAFGNTNTVYREYSYGHSLLGSITETGLQANGNVPSSEDGPYTLYEYDFYGKKSGELTQGPELSLCDWNPLTRDRINLYTNYYQLTNNNWFFTTEEWTYPYDTNSTLTLVERTMEKLTGFSSTDMSETDKFDADTNQTTVKVTVDLPNKKVTTTTTVPQSILSAVQVSINGLLQTETTETVSQPTTHYYDALAREIGRVDPLGNLSGTQYDPYTGQVTATTNAQLQVTTMSYYAPGGTNAGMLYCATGPTGKKTYYNYNGFGQTIQIWGDVPYPEQRTYNTYGDQVTLTTYRAGTQWAGSSWPANTGPTADVTTWNYDASTGLLTNKTDAVGQVVKFDYYDNYSPKTRIWARGVGRTNLYTFNGDLVGMNYSDGTSVFFTNVDSPYLNRLAKPAVVIDASGTNVLTYDYAGRQISATCSGGLMSGIAVSNHFNTVYGRDFLKVSGTTPPLTNQFTYDSYGRLSTVSCGIYSAAYGYLPNSDLLQTTTGKSNSLAILTTTRTWQTGPRLQSIVNTANGTVVTSHSYAYDALDRRKSALLEDGSHWEYDYNDRNELTGARREWSDWTPVSGQQFAYSYDNIGNRISASSGGDTNGVNLRPIGYAVNALNQYTTITNLGYRDILGIALATNTVGVTNTVTSTGGFGDRKNEYFHRELTINNTNAPIWQPLSVSSGGSVSNGGFAFPAYTQTNAYDADGNLTSDGIWTYEWDAENRLAALSMTNIANVPSSNRFRLEFAYDYQGRRISKLIKVWSGSFTPQSTNRFVYDQWNALALLNPQSVTQAAFLWGQDLSGTVDGAGGVGGLVAVLEASGGQISNCHFPAYDANGNVTALEKATDLSVSARYEFSPFGELLRTTGFMAKFNPIRFSTKFCDDEVALVAYLKRLLDPRLGRWGSRDPEDNLDANNLYQFVSSDPVSSFDPLGTFTLMDTGASAGIEGDLMSDAAGAAKQMWSIYNRVKDAVDTFNTVQDLAHFADQTFDDDDGSLLTSFLSMGNLSISKGFAPLKERTTTLYRLVDKTTEEHLKFGVSWNPDKRYSQAQLNKWNAKLVKLAKGNRKSMLQIERFLHAVHPLGRLERNKWYRLWQGLEDVLK